MRQLIGGFMLLKLIVRTPFPPVLMGIYFGPERMLLPLDAPGWQLTLLILGKKLSVSSSQKYKTFASDDSKELRVI